MKNDTTSEFRIVIDGELSEDARAAMESALNKTAMDQAARLDLTKPGLPPFRSTDIRLNPEWFGIWIRRDQIVEAARMRDLLGQRGF